MPYATLKKSFFFCFLFGLVFVCVFCGDCQERLRAARLHGRLLRAALHRRGVLLGTAVVAALGSGPLLELEVLLCAHGEREVLRAAIAVDEDGRHALVGDRAVVAALGLGPALLLKDTGLTVREEEHDLTVATGQLLARGLGGLLGLAAVDAARRVRPTLLAKEDLVLAREGEGRAAVHALQLEVLRKRGALLPLCATTAACGLLAVVRLGLLLRGLALSQSCCLLLRNLLLELGDALVRTCQKVLHLL